MGTSIQDTGAEFVEVLAEDEDNEYAMLDVTMIRAHQHSSRAKGAVVRSLSNIVVLVLSLSKHDNPL